MPNYIVDGKSYFFVDQLSEDEAAERVRKFFGSSGTKAEAEEGTSDYLNPEDSVPIFSAAKIAQLSTPKLVAAANNPAQVKKLLSGETDSRFDLLTHF